jgi:hypothetical protein
MLEFIRVINEIAPSSSTKGEFEFAEESQASIGKEVQAGLED